MTTLPAPARLRSPLRSTRRSGPVVAPVPRVLREVGHLLWFRRQTARGRFARLAPVLIGAALVLAATLPAGADVDPQRRAQLLALLVPGLLAFVVASALGAAAGGGRELLAREPASVHPIDPAADHLGALLLAPLNAGWLVPTMALLGLTSAAVGVDPWRLLGAQALVLAWVGAATASAQALGWTVELVRRRPDDRARLATRLLAATSVGAVVAVVLARAVAAAVVLHQPAPSAGLLVALVAVAGAMGAVGAGLAGSVARVAPRSEGRVETRVHRPRATPRTDDALLRRLDRASVWRSLPLRRGLVVTAVAPALAVLAGGPGWSTLLLLPGLVASGGLLLFGVNLWCLDGRGVLWRESLPVAPAAAMRARLAVLAEILALLGASVLALGVVRAGVPTPAEAVAGVVAVALAVAQGLSAAARWSAAHPHAVDLRSPRATPAPPVAMLGYSLRLSLTATLTGLLLATLAGAGRLDLVALTGAVLLGVAGLRVRRAVAGWSDPVARATVVAAVAA